MGLFSWLRGGGHVAPSAADGASTAVDQVVHAVVGRGFLPGERDPVWEDVSAAALCRARDSERMSARRKIMAEAATRNKPGGAAWAARVAAGEIDEGGAYTTATLVRRWVCRLAGAVAGDYPHSIIAEMTQVETAYSNLAVQRMRELGYAVQSYGAYAEITLPQPTSTTPENP